MQPAHSHASDVVTADNADNAAAAAAAAAGTQSGHSQQQQPQQQQQPFAVLLNGEPAMGYAQMPMEQGNMMPTYGDSFNPALYAPPQPQFNVPYYGQVPNMSYMNNGNFHGQFPYHAEMNMHPQHQQQQQPPQSFYAPFHSVEPVTVVQQPPPEQQPQQHEQSSCSNMQS
jgi:hypothetical protein